jgi:HEAT repeat protein
MMLACVATFVAVAAYAEEPVPRSEAALIAVLESNADWTEKQTACRELRRVGRDDAVPALAALLNDPKLGHHALYALEPMPHREAGAALRDALDITSGEQQLGVIISLGARRDTKAVGALAKLMIEGGPEARATAAASLGRIASPKAVRALTKHGTPSTHEALLAAAQYQLDHGKKRRAANIYRDLIVAQPAPHIQSGAFYGLAYAAPHKTTDLLLDALRGEDSLLRDTAAQVIAETEGSRSTARYAEALPTLPVEGQVALLRGLGGRGDATAHPAVLQASASDDLPVKLAAIEALATVGNGGDVIRLATLTGSDNADVSGAARQALRDLQHPDADAEIATAIGDTSPATQVVLMSVLTDRMAPVTIELAMDLLDSDTSEVRIAALEALTTQGTPEHVPAIIASLQRADNADERAAASSALSAIAGSYGDAILPVVLEGMRGANTETQRVLLRVLGRIGTPDALQPVVAAVDHRNKAVGSEALRVLANWPTADAAPYLLRLAGNSSGARKETALGGYIRLAEESQKRTQMLRKATPLAATQAEKWMLLGAWGNVPTQESLKLLLPYLRDAEVQNEAAAAIINVSLKLGKKNTEGKQASLSALRKVIATCRDQAIRDRAQNTIKGL